MNTQMYKEGQRRLGKLKFKSCPSERRTEEFCEMNGSRKGQEGKA
jgi:hypothetical protein